MQKLIASVVSRLVISVPYLWMLIFFLIPFIIVFKISLSQVTMAIPPYTPTIDVWAGWQGLINSVSQFSWDNYTFLGSDPLYVKAYLSSVIIAAISTFLTLLGLSHRLRHGTGARHRAVNPADAGDPALLDKLPHPRLCVDRYSQA